MLYHAVAFESQHLTQRVPQPSWQATHKSLVPMGATAWWRSSSGSAISQQVSLHTNLAAGALQHSAQQPCAAAAAAVQLRPSDTERIGMNSILVLSLQERRTRGLVHVAVLLRCAIWNMHCTAAATTAPLSSQCWLSIKFHRIPLCCVTGGCNEGRHVLLESALLAMNFSVQLHLAGTCCQRMCSTAPSWPTKMQNP